MLYARDDFAPGGVLDVAVIRPAGRDPEGALYDPGRTWILVTDAAGLDVWPTWDPRTVAVICVDVVRARPWVTEWMYAAGDVLLVERAAVAGIPPGPLAGAARFRVHEAADARRSTRAGA